MFRNIFILFKKEILTYFNSLIAYVFLAVFLFLSSALFISSFFYVGLCEMRNFFYTLPWIVTIFASALTMRLWAEERKTGSIALLMSLPFSDTELVFGKFLAALTFGTIAILSTFPIPIMLFIYGNPDAGPIIGGYIGSIIYLGFLISLGMLFSALFEDQIVAFILTTLTGLIMIFLSQEFIITIIEGWLPGLGLFLKKSLGALFHFEPFSNGLLRYSDILFFFIFIGGFLSLNIFILKDWLRARYRKFFGYLIFAITVSIFFINAGLSDLSLGKIDLTENKLYTPSKITKKIFGELKDPLRVTYYVTLKQLPSFMRNLPRDLKDFFRELQHLSPYFSYRIVDPSNDPDLKEYLTDKGIYPFTVKTVEKDALSFRKIYSAIEISYLDKPEQIIPQVVPSFVSIMEYELASRVKKLLLPESPVIALSVPKYKVKKSLIKYWAEMGRLPPKEYDEFTKLKNLLRAEGFDVEETKLDNSTSISENTSLLLIIDPRNFENEEVKKVEEFIKKKNKPVVIALQRFRFKYDWNRKGKLKVWGYSYPIKIIKLLEKYGIGISSKVLCDEQFVPISIVKPKNVGGYTIPVKESLKIPIEIKILPFQMNKNVAFTNSISGLLYLWGNSLIFFPEKWKKQNLNSKILFTSSKHSWEIPFRLNAYEVKDFFPKDREKDYGKKPLAVYLENNDKKLRLLVIGCSEMFADRSIKAFGNAHFIVNIVNTLTLGKELVYLRAKGGVQRFIKPISDNEKILWRLILMGFVPLLWLIVGVLRFTIRKAKRLKANA